MCGYPKKGVHRNFSSSNAVLWLCGHGGQKLYMQRKILSFKIFRETILFFFATGIEYKIMFKICIHIVHIVHKTGCYAKKTVDDYFSLRPQFPQKMRYEIYKVSNDAIYAKKKLWTTSSTSFTKSVHKKPSTKKLDTLSTKVILLFLSKANRTPG